MKVKVLRTFRDKDTDLLHRKGNKIEVTKKRFEEINSTSFGILLEEIEEDGAIDQISLKKMNKESIVKYAKEVKDIELTMNMTRDEMLEKLGD